MAPSLGAGGSCRGEAVLKAPGQVGDSRPAVQGEYLDSFAFDTRRATGAPTSPPVACLARLVAISADHDRHCGPAARRRSSSAAPSGDGGSVYLAGGTGVVHGDQNGIGQDRLPVRASAAI